MNELKRLLNRKILLVFMAFIIINVFLYTYQQTRGTGLKELRNSTDQEEQLEYIKHYSDDIRQIQINAQQLMTFSIFADKDSFTYNNIFVYLIYFTFYFITINYIIKSYCFIYFKKIF